MRIRLAAVAALLSFVLTACVGTDEPAPQGDEGDAEAIGEAPPGDTEATLTIWHYHDEDMDGTRDRATAAFQEAYPDVELEHLYVDFANMRNRVLTAAASGDGPDVLVFDPMDTDVLVEAGALLDLTDAWQAYEDRDQYPDYAVRQVEDSVYAVQGYVNTTALWYNQDILDEAGVEPPETPEELGEALGAVTDAGHGGFALCGRPTNECETQAISWILGNDANYDTLDSPEATEVLDRFEEWTDAGYIPAEAVNWAQPDAMQAFASGGAAFVQAGNWNLQWIGPELDFAWGVVPLPGAVVAPGGEGEAIGAFSEHPELAWEYLRLGWWSTEAQLVHAEERGSIPIREDAAEEQAVQEIPHVDAWLTELESAGQRPPTTSGDIQAATQLMGELWSNLLGGQATAAETQERMVSEILPQFQ